ncbi:MAG TPA: alpha/beta hydrolase [Reyranella sp.]|nr:alpha/beta hydrolase [Reyranella sp.]
MAAAEPTDAEILASVHPELRPIAQRIMAITGQAPPLTRASLPQSRKGNPAFRPKPLADVPFERRAIPGGLGRPEVGVVVVNAKPGASRPAILHTHGGGFVMGSAEESVPDLQQLCRELDCVAVSVDYRLAPETTYAGSTEDNYAGLKWLHASAASLGADPARIAVMGESAGGGHAALLALTARDRGEVPVCFQCLTYPMLDDRTGSSRRVPRHVGNLIWTAASNRFGWASFLGTAPGGSRVPARAVPARVANLAGLPPAWIGVGSVDLFFDEDVDYAQRLNNAGVPAELVVVPGAFHGFDNPMFPARVSRRFVAARLAALKSGLGLAN